MVIYSITNRAESVHSYPDICFNCRYLIRHPSQVCGKFSVVGASFIARCDYFNTLSRNSTYTSCQCTTMY